MKYALSNPYALENKAVHESPLIVAKMKKALARLKRTGETEAKIFVPWSDFVFSVRNGQPYLPPTYAVGLDRWKEFYRALPAAIQEHAATTDEGMYLTLQYKSPHAPCPTAACQSGLVTWLQVDRETSLRHELLHLYQNVSDALIESSQQIAPGIFAKSLFDTLKPEDHEQARRLFYLMDRYFPRSTYRAGPAQAGLFPSDKREQLEYLGTRDETKNKQYGLLVLRTEFGDLRVKDKMIVCSGRIRPGCDVYLSRRPQGRFLLERVGDKLDTKVRLSSLRKNNAINATTLLTLGEEKEVQLVDVKGRPWILGPMRLLFIQPYVTNLREPVAHALVIGIKAATRALASRRSTVTAYEPDHLVFYVIKTARLKLQQFADKKQRFKFLLSAYQYAIREVNRKKNTTYSEIPTNEIAAVIQEAVDNVETRLTSPASTYEIIPGTAKRVKLSRDKKPKYRQVNANRGE